MGNLTGKYDPNAEAQSDYWLPPTGEYKVQAVDGDVKASSGNKGEYAEFTLEIAEGEFKGRKYISRITLHHENNQATEIGQRQLAAFRAAIGLDRADDTTEYLWKPFAVRIEHYPVGSIYAYGQKKGQTRDRADAEVKAWKKLEGGAASAAPYARPATDAQPAATTVPNWARNAA